MKALNQKYMKTLFTLLIVITLAGCSKESGEGCWTCTVVRMDGSEYRDTKCGGTDTAPPQWVDQNNNMLNAYDCEKK